MTTGAARIAIVKSNGSPEAGRLLSLERVIEGGLQTFVDVGLALMEIREARLYRATHKTFEDYCRDRWEWSRVHADRLIKAAEVADILKPVGFNAPERVARELAPLRDEPETVREVWAETQRRHGPTPTAKQVAETRDSRLAVHFSSDTPEWYTPKHIVTAVTRALGAIDLDPCADPDKAIKAATHFTAKDDGLTKKWSGRVYMNPPYGDVIGEWTRKLLTEYTSGRVSAAIALVPARTDTKWFDPLFKHPICFISGRLHFGGAETGAPFPSACVFLGRKPKPFVDAFANLGNIVGPFD
jgi:phage N-6-adenine-methyltransferase